MGKGEVLESGKEGTRKEGAIDCIRMQPRVKYGENGKQTIRLSNVEAKWPHRSLGGVVGTKACPE